MVEEANDFKALEILKNNVYGVQDSNDGRLWLGLIVAEAHRRTISIFFSRLVGRWVPSVCL